MIGAYGNIEITAGIIGCVHPDRPSSCAIIHSTEGIVLKDIICQKQ
ncbi:MAG: hypothetical protein V3V84_00895 [Candidatus Bathyarchaeia archaeon]